MSAAGPLLSSIPSRVRALSRRPSVWFAALLVALSVAYVRQSWPPVFTASPYAHGDGSYYFAYLRSLAFDRDVDFSNDYTLIGNQFGYGRNVRTGRPENVFTIGPAVLWLPFAAVGQAVVRVGNATGGAWEAPDGTGPRFQRIVFFGSVAFGVAALALGFALAAPIVGRGMAFAAALGMATGTPLLWFMLRQPSYSHAAAALTVAAFVVVWFRTQRDRSLPVWAALGGLLGVAMLVRPQEATHALLPLADWLALSIAAIRARDGRALRRVILAGVAFAAATLIAFSPQMLAWRAIYGRALTIPQGGGFMQWGASRFGAVLFSSRAGLFAWHPITAVAAVGLVALAFARERPVARFARLALLAIAAQAYVNGAASDWWGGWAFGGRRFLDCTVYLTFGLAASLAALPRLWARLAPRVRPAVPWLAVAAFAFFNLQLMDDYLMSRAPHAVGQPMKPIWSRAVVTALDGVYGAVGNAGSAPVSWWFSMRAGVSPERYDVAATNELLASGVRAASVPFTDERHAMGGFGEPATHEGRPCRWVEGTRATWVFVLRESKAIEGTVTVAAAAAGTKLRLRKDGHTIGERVLPAGWSDVAFALPAELASTGINYVDVEQEAPAPGPWPIGTTGVQLGWELVAESAGYHAGNHAALRFGSDPTDVRERGVTAFRLDPRRASVDRLGSFDTFGQQDADAAFARVVARLPAGTIVAVVAKDDASHRWGPAGDEALRAIGAKESLVGRYRASYAIVGVKGAAPGTAAEQLAPTAVARVVIGRPAEEQHRGTAWSVATLHVR